MASKSINSEIKYKNNPIKNIIYIGLIIEDIGISEIKKTPIIKKYKFEVTILGIFVQIDVIIIEVKHNPQIVPNKAHPHAPLKIHKSIGKSDVESKR